MLATTTALFLPALRQTSPMPSRAYRWFRPALLLLGSLTLTACSSVFFGGINAASSRDGIVEHRDQVFDAAHDLALDVYQPRGAVDAPVVVFFMAAPGSAERAPTIAGSGVHSRARAWWRWWPTIASIRRWGRKASCPMPPLPPAGAIGMPTPMAATRRAWR